MGHPVLAPYELTWEDLRLAGLDAAFPPADLPLEVEIGCGDDDFLLRSAEQRPGTRWLGIEYSHKRVRRQIRRVERLHAQPLSNVRFLWRPARDVVRPFLAPGRVHAFHVYFPDPWPKAHHARYRLLEPSFLADLAAALEPAGVVHFATDSRDYAEEVVTALAEVSGLVNTLPAPGWVTTPPAERTTVFEERWRAEGRTIHAMRFNRAPGPAAPPGD